MSEAAQKIIYPTFEVTYWGAGGTAQETVLVRPVTFNKLAELKKQQEKLIHHFVQKQGSLGELLTDKTVIAAIKTLAKMLPVIGKSQLGIDIDNLFEASDMIQIGRIFFTESIDSKMKDEGYKTDPISDRPIYYQAIHRYNPTPSSIARIHDLLFFEKFQSERDKFFQKIREEEEQKMQENLAKLKETEQVEQSIEELDTKALETPA